MIVHFSGFAAAFAELQDGIAFRFDKADNRYIGIKASRQGASGAVVIGLGLPKQGDQPRFVLSEVFESICVLAMPDLRLVPSSSLDDINLSKEGNYTAGSIYLFRNDAPYLAFAHGEPESKIFLLKVGTGELWFANSFYSVPIEIKRWAFVEEIWGKPVTLFTYPAGSPPMVFR